MLAHALSDWGPGPRSPHLPAGDVHVWRIALDPEHSAEPYSSLLSPEERERALRLRSAADRTAFVIAHGAMRTILAAYTQSTAVQVAFEQGPFGKPVLASAVNRARLEFNLAHSGDVALLAIARERAVGVDIARWDAGVDHSAVAERSFSPLERETLRSLADAPDVFIEAFYSAWTRKEAYLKATGRGLTGGLEHFDVSFAPGEPPALIADRTDSQAHSRWTMVSLAVSASYSAALAVARPVGTIVLFDAPAPLTAASLHAPHASA